MAVGKSSIARAASAKQAGKVTKEEAAAAVVTPVPAPKAVRPKAVPAPKAPAAKPVSAPKAEGKRAETVSFGQELPVYLL